MKKYENVEMKFDDCSVNGQDEQMSISPNDSGDLMIFCVESQKWDVSLCVSIGEEQVRNLVKFLQAQLEG